jgi:hypothetical protein
MLKPFAASCKAYSLPIPSEAPVTTAQLPLRPNLESYWQSVLRYIEEERYTHRGAGQNEQTSNKSPEAEDLQGDIEETDARKQGSDGLLPGVLDKHSHFIHKDDLMLSNGQRKLSR